MFDDELDPVLFGGFGGSLPGLAGVGKSILDVFARHLLHLGGKCFDLSAFLFVRRGHDQSQ